MSIKKRGPVSATVWCLGLIVGTLSLASLVQRWGNIGIVGLTDDILSYYRAVTLTAKRVLLDWWTVRVWPDFLLPVWVVDVFAVWSLAVAASWRGGGHLTSLAKPLFIRGEDGGITEIVAPDHVRRPLLIICLGPFAYIFFLGKLLRLYWRDRRDDFLEPLQKERVRSFAFSITPVIGTAMFFAWNAIQI